MPVGGVTGGGRWRDAVVAFGLIIRGGRGEGGGGEEKEATVEDRIDSACASGRGAHVDRWSLAEKGGEGGYRAGDDWCSKRSRWQPPPPPPPHRVPGVSPVPGVTLGLNAVTLRTENNGRDAETTWLMVWTRPRAREESSPAGGGGPRGRGASGRGKGIRPESFSDKSNKNV